MRDSVGCARGSVWLLIGLGTFFILRSAGAQVPQLISYQGRVAVNGTNFDGTGLFRFALVDGTGAVTNWSSGTNAVPIAVSKGLYSVLLGDGTLSNMAVLPSTVFTNSDVRLRVWFDDGVHGSQQLTPDQRIAAVGYALMAASVSDGAITSGKIAAGAVGSVQLADGAVTSNKLSAGAAAASYPSGSMALAEEESPALAAAGYVRLGTSQVGDNWRLLDYGRLAPRRYHSAVWTGTELILWGGAGAATVLGDGIRYNPAQGTWSRLPANGAPSPRWGHSVVWSGTEVIIWGGQDAGGICLNDGARFNPVSGTWLPISPTNAPSARYGHTAVWLSTGRMVIWGGQDASGYAPGGGRYAPQNDTWAGVNPHGMPAPRADHTAVAMSDVAMLIWGGRNGGGALGSGGRYDTKSDVWSEVRTTDMAPRYGHAAAWSGEEMVIWGGQGADGSYLNDGRSYNPTLDLWSSVPTNGAPSARARHTVLLGERDIFVWGGVGTNGCLADGARYRVGRTSWTALGSAQAPAARADHAAVWTGSRMLIWGGTLDGTAGAVTDDGAQYDAAANTWSAASPGLASRSHHTAVWTGTELLIWGGFHGYGAINANGEEYAVGTVLDDGARYNPALNVWTAMPTNGAPSPREFHTALWTGTEMLIWGGSATSNVFPSALGDGARFNPVSGTWSPVSLTNAPSARYGHTATWCGGAMIVWGGRHDFPTILGDGARYVPSSNTWTALPLSNAPSARTEHAAVWDGNELLVWGGCLPTGTNTVILSDGARYDPLRGAWTPMATLSYWPGSRGYHRAVWSGTEMLAWGGAGDFGREDEGFRYDPRTGLWRLTSTVSCPIQRYYHVCVWAENRMLVWGGARYPSRYAAGTTYDDGGSYDPVHDLWTPMGQGVNPQARLGAAAVWSGREMLIFGGYSHINVTTNRIGSHGFTLGDTWAYTPGKTMVLYQKP